MDIKDVHELKQRPMDRLDEITKDYNNWVKKIRILPNSGFWATIVISVGAVILFDIEYKSWPAILLFIIAFRSLIVIAEREGHKEGYIDGYLNGFDAGINEALGIDKEMDKFIHEVLVDQSLQRDQQKIKSAPVPL